MKLIDLNFADKIKDTLSFESLQMLKLPNKNIEEFKRFDLNDLYEYDFNFNYTSYFSIEEFEYLKNENFYTIFITNSRFMSLHSSVNDNITFSSTKKTKNESKNSLYYLSELFFEQQNQIMISKSLDKPLLIINLFKYEDSFVPLSLNIHLEKNCKADIVELFISKNCGNSFLNINRTFNLNENVTLNYTKAEEFSNFDTSIFNYNSNIQKKSTLNIVALDYNAKKSLNIWDFDLMNEDISLKINAIININRDKQSANIANILHNNKNISSEINVQHILNDKSSAVFDVKSTINENAKYAKVLQSSKTTLLSDDAKINAQPRLQIFTDELEARHSATTGALNKDQLYYLTSRGISNQKAIEMIIESFEIKIIEKIENNLVKDYIKRFKGKTYV